MAAASERLTGDETGAGWRYAAGWIAAVLISLVFLVAGIWKLTDPTGAGARLAQAKVPESLSVIAAVGLGILETFAGVMLLVPRLRRWGAVLGTVLLAAFMAYIGYHYSELRGEDCSCFPWIRRAVGPGFFMGDGAFILLAVAAGVWARRAAEIRKAALILAAVVVFAGGAFAVASMRQTGTPAPATITAEDGKPISLKEGRVFLFFFDPQCLHCLAAGRKLATLDWANTRLIGVPTQNPQFGDWFFGKANLTGKGLIAKDLDRLKATFPFDVAPAGVAIENGHEKAMLLKFEQDSEPQATLKKIGFIY